MTRVRSTIHGYKPPRASQSNRKANSNTKSCQRTSYAQKIYRCTINVNAITLAITWDGWSISCVYPFTYKPPKRFTYTLKMMDQSSKRILHLRIAAGNTSSQLLPDRPCAPRVTLCTSWHWVMAAKRSPGDSPYMTDSVSRSSSSSPRSFPVKVWRKFLWSNGRQFSHRALLWSRTDCAVERLSRISSTRT